MLARLSGQTSVCSALSFRGDDGTSSGGKTCAAIQARCPDGLPEGGLAESKSSTDAPLPFSAASPPHLVSCCVSSAPLAIARHHFVSWRPGPTSSRDAGRLLHVSARTPEKTPPASRRILDARIKDHCRRYRRPTHHHAIHYQPPTPRMCLDQIQPTHLERAHRTDQRSTHLDDRDVVGATNS